MNGIDEHIYQSDDGKWHFWDETGADSYGPFDTQEQARESLVRYAKWLDGQV